MTRHDLRRVLAPLLLLLALPAGAEEFASQRIETPFCAVYRSEVRPAGLYAERYGGQYYWVPGAERPSALIRRIIATGRRGEPLADPGVRVLELEGQLVYLTSAPPLTGYYSESAQDAHAWIPGVSAPDEIQRAALAQALAPAPPVAVAD
jgi:hypothetical protein